MLTNENNLSLLEAVLGLGPDVRGARRLILVALAMRVDEEGWCEVPRADLAREIGANHPDRITANLAWLEGRGYILREQQYGAHGGLLSNRYRLLVIPADKEGLE